MKYFWSGSYVGFLLVTLSDVVECLSLYMIYFEVAGDNPDFFDPFEQMLERSLLILQSFFQKYR